MVVGLEVLAIYSHVSYYPSIAFLAFSYISIALATAISVFVFLKFTGVIRPEPAAA